MRQTLNDAGTPLASAWYDPWGTPQGSALAPFGFTGELQDAGLVYLRARWYNPGSGTFHTRDPFAGWSEQPYSLQPYAYALGDPVQWTDASGRWPQGRDSEAACVARGGTWDDSYNYCRERVPLPPPTNPAPAEPQYRVPRPAVIPGVDLPGVGVEANPTTGTLGLPPAGTVNPPRVRGGTGVGKLIGIIGLLCLAAAADTLSKTENPPAPTCDQYTIPISCATDFKRFTDTSGQCFECATRVAKKIQQANPTAVVTIVELENAANPPGTPPKVARRFGQMRGRDGQPVGTTGLHEVVAINGQCFLDALVYKYYGLQAVTWAEYDTVWEYSSFVRPTGNIRLPGSTRR